ncbi:MAG: hypothetical protein EA353_04060 [Puniceicoccaceae bacterium]|nr:MAG: hypothetical protein EA353_04060 [Puniceicoccaceae bacterium]
MNYGIIAGCLVTISLILLSVETALDRKRTGKATCFVVLYSSGVVLWLVLGVLLEQIPLLLISAIQLFSLATFYFADTRND